MKVKYFSYCLVDNELDYYQFDLRGFLEKFCSCHITEFKKSFHHIDEKLYIFDKRNGKFVFIKTKSDDIIKKIDTNTLSFDDIRKLLSRNDQLGYAAYIYVEKEYFALGSTLFAPKIRIFQEFISRILQAIGLDNNFLFVDSITREATTDDLHTEKFLGKTTIQIPRESGIFEDIGNTLLGRMKDQTDIGSFEITIKPRRGRNIKKEIIDIAEHLDKSDYEKFTIKAKDELNSQLTELYLEGKGAISDFIASRNEEKILSEISEAAGKNKKMREKAKEAYNHEEIQKSQNNPNHNIIFVHTWDNRIRSFLGKLPKP